MTSTDSPNRPFGRTRVPAFTGEEATAFDARAIHRVGVPEPTLMENAGRSAASVLQHLVPRGRVVVLAGSGNNGGDAVVVARTLAAWGRDVTLVAVGTEPPDWALAHGWELDPLPAEDVDRAEKALAGAAAIVDGILGTGLRGAPRDPQAGWIERVNEANGFRCALDLPSGVASGSGRVEGPAVRAHLTVAFGGVKLGTLLHPGRAHAGRLVAVEIGFPPVRAEDTGQWVITPAWAADARPARSPATHKNAVGPLTVVAGKEGMAGAAVLAARAALRAGAGLVRVVSPASNREVIQEAVPEAIFVAREDRAEVGEALALGKAALVGPGIGLDDAAVEAIDVALSQGEGPLVLDADALTLVGEGRPCHLTDVAARRPVVVTPHAGELARIHAVSTATATAEPVAAAREAAHATGAVVLFKGAPSVVADPSGVVWIAGIGSSDLAVGGMGDALAGAVTAFTAQGAGAGEAACLALHWTGRAALVCAKGVGLIPSDVVEALPGVLRETGPGHTDLPFGFVIFDQDPPR